MLHQRRFRIFFWILLAVLLIFAVQSSPAMADLSGSYVTFAPSVVYETGKTSASCYEPGNWYQVLCFNLETTSPDGQDATGIALQFPADWEVYGRWIGDHYDYTSIEHSCTNGGSMAGATSWTSTPWAGQYWGGDARVQNAGTSCHALYCFTVWDKTDPGDPPYDDELDALVSWSWDGPTGAPPSSVCSSDGLFPQEGGYPCDEVSTDPPALVPVCDYVEIPILPETLPHAVAGQFYTQQLSPIPQVINPGTGETDYWYSYSGDMPDDFALFSNTGEIEWNDPQIGTHTFTAYVQGPDWSEGSREYTIVVDPQLIFEPDQLPPARLNTAYHQPITVSGGTAPYILSLLSGTLPEGMSFTNGAFTGTPTETGTFPDLVVRAVDGAGADQTHTYTLNVLAEHLFTWTPENPASGQLVTFTAEPGFDYYEWSYGYDPDGECDVDVWGNNQELTIALYGRGDHKVCLELTDYSPTYVNLFDEQWVTVTNGPPTIDYYWNYPYPSFPGQLVEAGFDFNDYDGAGVFTCDVDWGDGTTDTVPANAEEQRCDFPPHAYDMVGDYQIDFSVTDDEGAFAEASTAQQVLWLYGYDDDVWLASNTLPTTLSLYAYAPEGTQNLQFEISSNPEHGSLGIPSFVACESESYMQGAMFCWASVVFTPQVTDPLYVGWDGFEFSVSDEDGHTSEPALVELWLDENGPPTADDGLAVVSTVMPSRFSIFGSDMDAYNYIVDEISFHIDTPPEHGTLHFEEDSNIFEWLYDGNWNVIGAEWSQLLTYTPNPGSTATTDTFTFHLNDTHQDSNVATVTLNLHTPTTLHVNVNDDVVDAAGCDETHCSLREAVAAAEIGDAIDFTLELPNMIVLTWEGGGELLINKNIHVLGPGADLLSISAGFEDSEMNPEDGFRVFHIFNDYDPVTTSISGLTIRDGRADEGGGVYVDEYATLTISDCVIGPNNIVSYAGGGMATNEADVIMTNCSVVENHGTGTVGGAGIFVDDSIMTITNSTISGNVTNNYGGGILAYDDTTVTLINVTVSGNLANQNYEAEAWGGGGGIYIDGAEVYLRNTIIAVNADLTQPSEHPNWPDVKGNFISLGGNLIGDETGSTGWLPSDLVGNSGLPLDPMLGLLDVYEPGRTPTFPLLEGSPAIDSAACIAAVKIDQRGVRRPQGMACDRGAFELENPLTYLFIPLILR